MAKQLFQYSPFIEYAGEVTEESGKRQYMSKCGLSCASTTTVLSQYEDLTNAKGEDTLEVWGNKMRKLGLDPDEISAESARVGTAAHSLVEEYILQGVYCLGNLVEEKLAAVAIDNFYSYVEPEFANAEQPLFYNGLLEKNPEPIALAGRYDQLLCLPANVFQFKNGEILDEPQFIIADLKTKRSYQRSLKTGKIKKKSLPRTDVVDMMFKNCLQLSFYAAALTKQTNFKDVYGAGIVGATLVYVNEEDCKICYLTRRDLNYYFKVFKEILRDFYGVKKLEKSWREMVNHANGRYNYDTCEWENNIPKEIMLIKN